MCGVVIDKSLLALTIAEAETITEQILYTPATWSALQSALTAAKAVNNSNQSLQSAVDAAQLLLRDKIDTLVLSTADDFKAILDALIQSVSGYVAAAYKSGWAAFASALSSGQTVYGNSSATISEIIDAIDTLQNAIDGLVLLPPDNYIINGDFVQGQTAWNATNGSMAISPNSDDTNPDNTSAFMATLTAGWTRMRSADVITITEPGKYRLSAWGMAPGATSAHLFLTYAAHSGASENDIDWRWDFVFGALTHELANLNGGGAGGPNGSWVRASAISFVGSSAWTYKEAVFDLPASVLAAYNNTFRVAFRKEGNEGSFTLTGLRLEKVCDDCERKPCICDIPYDKYELELAIGEADLLFGFLYTPTTWADLQTALTAAKVVYNNNYVLQVEIDAAKEELRDKMNALDLRLNSDLRELLATLIALAKTYNQNLYKAGSWNILANALAIAESVYANLESPDVDIANAYINLERAIAELVEKPNTLNIGDSLFDDEFSRYPLGEGSVDGWPHRNATVVFFANDKVENPAQTVARFNTSGAGWDQIRKPIYLQGNTRYRMSAWVRGGFGDISGVILTPKLGSPNPPGGTHATICHDTWCGCESHRTARIIAQNVANWEFREVEFVLDADLDGEVLIRAWPGGQFWVSDIRIEVVEVYETYDVTFGVIGAGGALNAAIGQTPVQPGAAVGIGKNITFTAVPATGYVIDKWMIDGEVTNGENATYSAEIYDKDLDVRVYFRAAASVKLIYSANGNGSVIAKANGESGGITGGTTVVNGASVTEGFMLAFTASPQSGHEVKKWIVNGVDILTNSKLYTVAYLSGVDVAGTLTFTVEVVFGATDNGRDYNGTNKGQLGMNVSRPSTWSNSINGLPGGLNATIPADYLQSLEPFGVLRFMDFTNTNGHVTKSEWDTAEENMWASVVAIANETNKDIWICVPVRASDNYIRTLATYMKNNLNDCINVFVEWGNEVWGFEAQRNVNVEMAAAKGIVDNRDPWNTYETWWPLPNYYHFAQRTADIAFIFRDVFEEDDVAINLSSRVRPVLTWQQASDVFVPMMDWLEGRTPQISDPIYRNAHEYIWAVGIAPYFGEPNTALCTNIDYIHRYMLNSIENGIGLAQNTINAAKTYNLVGGAVTYEGGPHYGGDGTLNLATRTAAQKHSLMTDLIKYYISNYWYALGGGLFCYYSHIGSSSQWGYWGAMDNLSLDQFTNAPKYAALRWVSEQPIGTLAPRPVVKPAPPFSNPITNGSFENTNPLNGWNVDSSAWSIDRYESIDGFNSLKVNAFDANWREASWSTPIELEPNKDYVFSFWHKGLAGYKVIIYGGGVEHYIITEQSDDWVEYLIPFNSGEAVIFNIKMGHEWNGNEWRLPAERPNPIPGKLWTGDAWFDFFNLEENLIANGSFEDGDAGWSDGLGWTGTKYYAVSKAEAFHGVNSMKIFGNVLVDDLNSAQFEYRNNTEYRFIFYNKGAGNTNVKIEGAANITTEANYDWQKYETKFSSSGLLTNVGQVMLSNNGSVNAYLDKFMLFKNNNPVLGVRVTVMYNLNHPEATGTAPATLIIPFNSRIGTMPPDPAAISGWTFAGWNTAIDGSGTNWIFGPAGNFVLNDMTLYAQWTGTSTENIYTVTFNLNGGNSLASLTQRVVENDFAVKPATDPTKAGFTFDDWYTAAEGGDKWDFGTMEITGDTVIHAQWTPNKYAIAFELDVDGGVSTIPAGIADITNIGHGETVAETSKPADPVASTGFVFDGWFIGSIFGTKFIFGLTEVTSNITLVAKWSVYVEVPCTCELCDGCNGCFLVPNCDCADCPGECTCTGEFTVIFNPNGGTCLVTSLETKDGILTLPNATYTGYTFKGWFPSATGGTSVGGAGSTYTPTADITLFAQWEKVEVTFSVPVKSMTAKVGTPLLIPMNYNGDIPPTIKTSNAAICDVVDGKLVPKKAGLAVITITVPGFPAVAITVTVSN
jgi:uncharacterized repeat protein (TIGR02543 family)